MYSDDDSDFYGDELTVAALESRVLELDTDSWWATQTQSQTPSRLQAKKKHNAQMTNTQHLHNPYAGVPGAWQLTETVDDFLERCPPATTDVSPGMPWIWICNPYIQRKAKSQAQNQKVRGCEDEAPEEDNTNLDTFIEGGEERLAFASEFIDEFKKSGQTRTIITRETQKAGADAARDILGLAQACRVRCGKWMLFVPVHAIDEVWGIVAKATANNELGVGAKVAPRPEEESDDRSERLICVYTADFGDKEDVKRVALTLKQLGLILPREKPLYYKPDAYTYLGISSNNPWGIRASIYNSTDVIGKN